MTLAVHEDIGRTHDERGRAMLEAFAKKLQWEVQQGPGLQPAPIDAVFTQNGCLLAVGEGRTRITHTLQDIRGMGNTYLVTHQKLLDLMEGGRLFGVPSLLIVELACGSRLAWAVGDRTGTPYFNWDIQRTQTRATSLDDRQTVRANAFLPVEKAKTW